MDVPAPPSVATPKDIGTEIGNGRALETGAVEVSTTTQWTRIVPIDKDTLAIAGDTNGDAVALVTKDGGRSFYAHALKSSGIVRWSVGVDGTVVLSTAVRQIPKRALPAGELPPIDRLTFYFGAPGQKITAAAPFLAPDEKGTTPTVPRGDGSPTVLGPTLASVVVEIKPKVFAVAFAGGPGEALPVPIQLPNGELPVQASFGRAPQLLTIQGARVLTRPWPRPGAELGAPKPIDKLVVTKTLIDELSSGPECEFHGWSFKRVAQPPNRTVVLGVSPDKWTVFELPPSVVNSSPMACSTERVVVEAISPVDNRSSLVTCSIDGACLPPENRPFLKPWSEPHERKLGVALTAKGIIAVQHQKTKTKWTMAASESNDGGKLYNLERRIGGAETNPEDGYDLGALVGLGDRSLLFLTAKVTGSTRRSWYVISSDDGGLTWNPP